MCLILPCSISAIMCTCASAQTQACPGSTEIHSIVKPPAKKNGQIGISAAFAFVLVAYVTLAVSAYWVCRCLATGRLQSHVRLHLAGFGDDGSLPAACRHLATTFRSW